jgi:hypothetical protein
MGEHSDMAEPILVQFDESTPAGEYTWYFSTAAPGLAPSVTEIAVAFDDSDIVQIDKLQDGTLQFSLFFDGSDVGLTKASEDIDAFAILPDGSLLMSTSGTANVPGVTAERQDILRFIPSSTGQTTAGTWELYFDGSDVGLDTSGENIVGLSVLADGSLAVATQQGLNVAGLSLPPQDIARFTPTQLGATTAGTWSLLFDGSANGLTKNSEKIDALSTTGDGVYELSTQGGFNVGGVSGADEDVFRIDGANVELILDSSQLGITGNDINAWHSQPVQSVRPRHEKVVESWDLGLILTLNRPTDGNGVEVQRRLRQPIVDPRSAILQDLALQVRLTDAASALSYDTHIMRAIATSASPRAATSHVELDQLFAALGLAELTT